MTASTTIFFQCLGPCRFRPDQLYPQISAEPRGRRDVVRLGRDAVEPGARSLTLRLERRAALSKSPSGDIDARSRRIQRWHWQQEL